jgi:hypothetical protein
MLGQVIVHDAANILTPGQFVNDPPKIDDAEIVAPELFTDTPAVNDDDPPKIDDAEIVALAPEMLTPKAAFAVPPRITLAFN